jgi:PTH1 family peptidyl-tRNA hydrolase
MLLFAGLGNPEPRYASNRHNFGWRAVEAIHRRHRFGPWRRRFHGLAADGELGGQKLLLLLPLTYMNESGRAVAEASHFFKIQLDEVTVFHDELDLLPGKVRVKIGGGNAGHNGLHSITATCGNDYQRVRLGIGHPGHKDLVERYVLSDFAKADRKWVEAVCEAVADAAEFLALGRADEFQNRVHLKLASIGLFDSEPDKPAA